MKTYKNIDFKSISPEKIKDFEDINLIFESTSPSYQKLLYRHFQYQQRVDDRIWSDVYCTVATIAKEVQKNERTVHRFHKDLACVIFKKIRRKNGKQTSNTYKMHKTVYQYMKAFWRLGLWKDGVDFKDRWRWIQQLWID